MNEQELLDYLVAWAAADPRIRAVIWTSTRTNPAAKIDALSDYDIILVVDDVAPFTGDEWLGDFGPLLVVYRDPVGSNYGGASFGRVTQYEDGLKIDFTVMTVDEWRGMIAGPTLDNDLDVGYRVLLDKDGLTEGLPPPTYRAYIPTPPDAQAYFDVIELFFHEGTYVAKNLWRDELLPAKYLLDAEMRAEHVRTMLEWRMELDHDWSVKTGVLGKGLKKYLPPDLWAEFEATFAGASIEENWDAFFALIAFFRKVAVEVGERLGYDYPYDLDRRSMAYFADVRALDYDAAEFRRPVLDSESQ